MEGRVARYAPVDSGIAEKVYSYIVSRMGVKQATISIRITPRAHKTLKIRAARLGITIVKLVDALLKNKA